MNVVADFGRLVVKAFVSGLGVAVVMALAILALSANTHAAGVGINDPKTGALLARTSEAGRYAVVPTVATEVGITVTGMIARTRVTQHFHHAGADFVEGIYVFPLPESAAVDRLYVRIGDREIEGQVQEKAQARATYERARAEGRKAALVEQLRPNLFTNTVAHIGPDERVTVSIEYQQSLAYENGSYRLRFPLAVTPRYLPAGAMAETARDEVPDEGCGGSANLVDIAVTLDAGVPVAAVESSYHEAWIQKAAGNRVLVGLAKDQEQADRDFELTWQVAPGAAPRAAIFTESVGGRDYTLMMVVPPQPNALEKSAFERLPRETLLVVDTSGSMEGTSIVQAKAALGVALATLTPRDRFNVIEFNSEARALFPAAVPVTPQAMGEAQRFVGGLRARGGTEMEKALALALDGRETAGYLRQVVFITDGAVGNEQQLFRFIAARLGNARLFTVGIGSAPNGHFMAKAAQFGRGTFTHVGDVREVEGKMARLFEKIEAPVLRDVTLAWSDGQPVESFPARVPDLYLGEPIVATTSAQPGARSIVVSGLRGNQPWSVVLTPAAGEPSPGVGTLWARSKVSGLMDGLARGEDPEAVRKAVIEVALRHHLVSAYTSLVAVDVTPSNTQAKARQAVLRTSLPAGSATLPQTDTAATVHLLLGLLALGFAAMVAVIGRRS
jgi:Ca-activated chloride channel family protein